ncbi:hypothetical protein AB205_0046700, partial [Aquarana catesbeiana]
MEPTEAVEEHTAVSRSPCLLSNWVEERATAVLDRDPSSMNPIGHGHAERHGHRGILTTQLLDQIADSTTHQDSYRKPISDPTRQTVCEALTCAAEEVGEMESTTKRDFHVDGFVPQTPLPTKSQDYCTDQAITFWTENLRSVTGVSDVRSRDTPFKKSSAFSTPISQYLDQPVPYSLENYPNINQEEPGDQP